MEKVCYRYVGGNKRKRCLKESRLDLVSRLSWWAMRQESGKAKGPEDQEKSWKPRVA